MRSVAVEAGLNLTYRFSHVAAHMIHVRLQKNCLNDLSTFEHTKTKTYKQMDDEKIIIKILGSNDLLMWVGGPSLLLKLVKSLFRKHPTSQPYRK